MHITLKISKSTAVYFKAGSVYDTNTTLTINSNTVAADGIAYQYAVLTLKDAFNGKVTGETVSLVTDRGESDVITYSGDSVTDGQGQVKVYIRSTHSGTSTIHIQIPNGISKTASFRFTYGLINKFKVSLDKTNFTVGNDTTIITVKALDYYNNIVENYNNTVNLSATNNAMINPTSLSNFSNGICTGIVTITTLTVNNFNVLAMDNNGIVGVSSQLSSNDIIPPTIANVKVYGQSGINKFLSSQNDNTLFVSSDISDNSDSYTNYCDVMNGTTTIRYTPDNNIKSGTWTIDISSYNLVDGQSLNVVITSKDLANNISVNTTTVKVVSELQGYNSNYLDSNNITLISEDGYFTLKVFAGTVKSYPGKKVIFSIEHNSISSERKSIITDAINKSLVNSPSEYSEIKDRYYEVNAYLYNGTNYLEEINSNFLKTGKYAEINIKYPNNNNFKDVTAQDLIAQLLDEQNNSWISLDGSTVDYTNKFVKVMIPHFSVYGLGFQTYTNLNNVKIYPNPWTSDVNYTPTASLPKTDSAYGIKFINLPVGTTLKIYTVAGEKIKEKVVGFGDNSYNWNLTNADGSEIASGVYLYILEYNGQKRTGKLGVVK